MGKKLSVLIIDDDPDITATISFVLDREGFEGMVALDGAKGFEVARDQKPDFIILDLIMPPPDGWEVLKRLRSTPETKKIPILVLSARAQIQDIDRAMALGANSYMIKPFDVERLVQKISKVLAV